MPHDRRSRTFFCSSAKRPRAQVLQVDEFSDLLSDVLHRVIVSAETVAGAEERADRPNLVVGHPVHNGDQQVAGQQFGAFVLGHTWQRAEQANTSGRPCAVVSTSSTSAETAER